MVTNDGKSKRDQSGTAERENQWKLSQKSKFWKHTKVYAFQKSSRILPEVFSGPNTSRNCSCLVRKNYLKIHYFCRIGRIGILWTTLKDGGLAYLVYIDLIKDIIFLAIIINALGGIASVLSSNDWNFANTVSLKKFSSYYFHTFNHYFIVLT